MEGGEEGQVGTTLPPESETDSNPNQSGVNLGLANRSDLSQAHSWLVGTQGPASPASQQ